MSIKTTIVDAVKAFLQAELRKVNTSLPGEVVKYNPITQTADIRPMLKSSHNEDLPVIHDVPVVFPGGGGYKITFPLVRGDSVLLTCAQSSIDAWLDKAQLLDRPNANTFSLADAVAFPGVLAIGRASDQVGDAFILSGDTVLLGSKDASDPIVRQSDIKPLVTWAESHTHLETGGTTNSPTLSPPSVLGSPNLKAD